MQPRSGPPPAWAPGIMNIDVEFHIRHNYPWSKLPANVKQVRPPPGAEAPPRHPLLGPPAGLGLVPVGGPPPVPPPASRENPPAAQA